MKESHHMFAGYCRMFDCLFEKGSTVVCMGRATLRGVCVKSGGVLIVEDGGSLLDRTVESGDVLVVSPVTGGTGEDHRDGPLVVGPNDAFRYDHWVPYYERGPWCSIKMTGSYAADKDVSVIIAGWSQSDDELRGCCNGQ